MFVHTYVLHGQDPLFRASQDWIESSRNFFA